MQHCAHTQPTNATLRTHTAHQCNTVHGQPANATLRMLDLSGLRMIELQRLSLVSRRKTGSQGPILARWLVCCLLPTPMKNHSSCRRLWIQWTVAATLWLVVLKLLPRSGCGSNSSALMLELTCISLCCMNHTNALGYSLQPILPV